MSMVGSVATLKAVTEAAPRETGDEVSGSPLLVTGSVPRSEFERGDLRPVKSDTRKKADAENRAAGVSAAPKGTQATWGRLLPLPRNGRYAPSTAVGRPQLRSRADRMYIRSRYICEMKRPFQNGGTAWRSGFRRRSPKRPASTRETAWRWIWTATAALSCARPDGGTNCRNWSRGSRPRIVIGKRTGDSRKVRNPGEQDVCTRDR